ncbi:hypothetical protein ACVW00_001085 [Marmoricola sp. URHA0025 HA25]
MPELPFPDLATPVARATEPPPFEEVLGRARRRRRRTVLGTAAGTAAVVAAVAGGALFGNGETGSAPQPAKPSPSAGRTAAPAAADAARIVGTGGLLSYAGGADGSLLTVWRACSAAGETDCDSAWQLQVGGHVTQGLVKEDNPSVQAGTGGFVIGSWHRLGIVVDEQGQVRQIQRVGSGTVAPGDVFVQVRQALLVDPRTATAWQLATTPDLGNWVQASVAGDGSIWAMRERGHDLPMVWSKTLSPASPWKQHLMTSTDTHDSLPGYLATSGDHVAALSGFDGATVLPVADLAVTADGGATWTDLHQSDLPFRYVDSMAATSGGTLYVVTPAGEHLYRSTDASWTRFTEVPNPTRADTLVAAGDRVLARGGTFEDPVLVALDSAGHSTPVPVAR